MIRQHENPQLSGGGKGSGFRVTLNNPQPLKRVHTKPRVQGGLPLITDAETRLPQFHMHHTGPNPGFPNTKP